MAVLAVSVQHCAHWENGLLSSPGCSLTEGSPYQIIKTSICAQRQPTVLGKHRVFLPSGSQTYGYVMSSLVNVLILPGFS